MTNVERTKDTICQVSKCLEEGSMIAVDEVQGAILMDVALSLAVIADSLTVIKEKLTEESK